ncbi:MAG: radical SAM protein [Candidatus Thermoplasmatota archaeon]|jgi:pyruvate formate lyase activating enzyme|nr:radical SAM protein [Candidatus Thermoplasmatota archaeon]
MQTLFGLKNTCSICGKQNNEISSTIGVCLSCIRNKPKQALAKTNLVHKIIREKYKLPAKPPKNKNAIQCFLCINECKIGAGKKGYCGLRENKNGELVQPKNGYLFCYYDPLPTNCCASWFCPMNKQKGYSLAVFSFGCSFDCLFCQNHEHKLIEKAEHIEIDSLIKMIEKVKCLCFFGGSPEPQFPFLLNATKKILENKKINICWEWNGAGNPFFIKKAVKYSSMTNGTIKFDLKAFDKNLHLALTGQSNEKTLENFKMVAKNFKKKNLLTATTLLIPGYIDKQEIEKIAQFISNLNPDIPYLLLAFHPAFEMNDLPITSTKQATECYETAKKYLKNVNIGNKHLLW